MTIVSEFTDTMSSSNVFDVFSVSLVNFSYRFKFHVCIITGSRVMLIFFYIGLTGNPEIGNTSSKFLLISGDWGKSGIPNLTRIFLMKCY